MTFEEELFRRAQNKGASALPSVPSQAGESSADSDFINYLLKKDVQSTAPTQARQTPTLSTDNTKTAVNGRTARGSFPAAARTATQETESLDEIAALNKQIAEKKAAEKVANAPRTSEERESMLKRMSELEQYEGYATDELSAAHISGDGSGDIAGETQKLRQQLHEQDEKLGNKARYYDDAERTKGVFGGAFKQIGSAYESFNGTLTDVVNEIHKNDSAEQKALLDSGNEGYATDDLSAANITAGNSDMHGGEIQRSKNEAQNLYKRSDALAESASKDIAQAKEGLSGLGQAGVDIATNLIQMGVDAVGNAVGLGMLPFFVRAAGGSMQEARQEGASVGQTLGYGLTKGGIEVATEKMFDGVAGLFGAGAADEVVEKLVGKLAKTDTGRTVLRAIINASGEGVEEVVSDLLSPFAKQIYNNTALKDVWTSGSGYGSEMLYDFLIGAALGSFGAVGSVATGQSAAKDAKLRYEEATGVKAKAEKGTNDIAPSGLFGAASGKSLKSGAEVADSSAGRDISINTDSRDESSSEQDSSVQSGTQETVLPDDGRTDSGAFQDEASGDRGQEARRSWKDLSDDERSRFAEIVARHADDSGTEELSELRDTTSDAFVAERIYDDLQSGDAAVETWSVYFDDLPSLFNELKSITSALEVAGAAQNEDTRSDSSASSQDDSVESSSVAIVAEIISGGRMSNTVAAGIVASPELSRAFTGLTGIELNGTNRENVMAVQEAARRRAYAAQDSERLARMAADEAIADEAQLRGLYADAPPAGYDSYIRGIFLKGGANSAEAAEILSNPQMRTTWEQMTGKTLPESSKSAMKMIMETQRDVSKLNAPTMRVSGYDSYIRGIFLKGGANSAEAAEILSNPQMRATWEWMTGKVLPKNSKVAMEMIIDERRDASKVTPPAQSGTWRDAMWYGDKSAQEAAGAPVASGNASTPDTGLNAGTGQSQELNSDQNNQNDSKDRMYADEDAAPETNTDENNKDESENGTKAYSGGSGTDVMGQEDIGEEEDKDVFEDRGYSAEDAPPVFEGSHPLDDKDIREDGEAPHVRDETTGAAQKESAEMEYRLLTEFGEKTYQTLNDVGERMAERSFAIEQDPDAVGSLNLEDVNAVKVGYKNKLIAVKNGIRDMSRGLIDVKQFKELYDGLNVKTPDGDIGYYYDEVIAKAIDKAVQSFELAQASPREDSIIIYRNDIAEMARVVEHRMNILDDSISERTRINSEMNASKPKLKRGLKGAIDKFVNGFWRSQMRPDTLFYSLGGFDKAGSERLYALGEKARQSTRDKINIHEKAQNFFGKAAAMDSYSAFATGKAQCPVNILGYGTFSQNYALGIYKTLKTKGAIEHIARHGMELSSSEAELYSGKNNDGFGTQAGYALYINLANEIMQMNPNITREQAISEAARSLYALRNELEDFVQSTAVTLELELASTEAFKYIKGEINNTSQKVNGTDKALQNDDYYPLQVAQGDSGFSELGKDSNKLEDMSIVQRREGDSGTLKILPFTDTVSRYIDSASDYAAFTELSDELTMLSKNYAFEPSMKYTMESGFGKEYGKWLDEYVYDLNNSRAGDTSTLLRKIRSNVASAALLANPGVAINQKSSYFNFGGEVDMKTLLQNWHPFRSASRWQSSELVRNVGKYTGVLESRGKGYNSVEMGEATQQARSLSGKINSKLPGWMSSWITKSDYETTANGLAAIAAQVKAENPEMSTTSDEYYQLVASRFENAVLKTQQTYTKQYRAAYLRSQSDWVRGLSMFRSQPTATLNNLMVAKGEYDAAKSGGDAATIAKAKEHYGSAVAGFVSSNVMYAVIGAVVKLLFHKKKDFEDEEGEFSLGETAKTVGLDFFETMCGTVWFGDQIAALGADITTGLLHQADDSIEQTSEFYDFSGGADGVVESLTSGIVGLAQNPSLKSAADFTLDVSSAIGVPARNIYRLLNTAILYTLDATGDNPRGYDDCIKMLNDINRMDVREKAAYTVDKAVEYCENGQYRRAEMALATVSDGLGSAVKEIIDSDSYKNLDEEQRAAVIDELKTFAKDNAEVLSGDKDEKDLAGWEKNLDGIELGLYLVAKEYAKSLYDDNGEIIDYKLMDEYLSGTNSVYGRLTAKGREALGESRGRLDDMYNASRKGIDSKTYDSAYKLYQKYDNKELGSATDRGEDLDTAINKMPGLTQPQKDWLSENLTLWQHLPADTDSYDELVSAGVSHENANKLMDDLGALQPRDGYKKPQAAQRYHAISDAAYLSEEEKWAAFLSVATNSAAEDAQWHRNMGFTFVQWVNSSSYCKVKGGASGSSATSSESIDGGFADLILNGYKG